MELRSWIPDIHQVLSMILSPRSKSQRLKAISFLLVVCMLLSGAYADDDAEGDGEGGDEGSTQDPSGIAPNGTCSDPVCEDKMDMLQRSMDDSINPCVDFYAYMCGNYTAPETPLDAVIHFLMRGKAENQAERQAQTFYRSCLSQNDHPQRNLNLKALQDVMEDLGGWELSGSTMKLDMPALMNKVHNKYGATLFFAWGVNFDPTNSSQHVILITPEDSQSGFWRRMTGNENQIQELSQYLVELMVASDDPGQNNGPQLVQMVKDIIQLNDGFQRSTMEELTYEKLTVSEMDEIFPHVNFTNFFYMPFLRGDVVISTQTMLSVFNRRALENLALVISESLSDPIRQRTLANYIKIRALIHVAQNLETDPDLLQSLCLEAAFKRLTAAMNSIYVRQSFTRDSTVREDVTNLFGSIKKSFSERLSNMTWMDDLTKLYAMSKVQNMSILAGYPDKYFDDSYMTDRHASLALDPLNLIENVLRIQKFNLESAASTLLLAANKTDAFDIYHAKGRNAFYLYGVDCVLVLPRLLQEPFYHTDYPDTVKYAALSFILSRELIHAFFVPDIYVDHKDLWMSEGSFEEFQRLSQCYVDRYSKFSFNGTQLNGTLKLDENIADVSGLALGYDVFKSKLNQTDSLSPVKPGISADQYYYMEFAHFLCREPNRADSPQEVAFSRHSPSPIRVNGATATSVDFKQAFKCFVKDEEERCPLWYD
ncbi:neprilysin-3 [Galendromus occidentalis]|uniref:Neprilysin-3 n=1 Tax=Galendromus occidentalis TaxID=34638 RepID=A0AAJ6QPY3_9ACAR|nr:neprilysin-3 [Galendromus occidentalis]